jgi:hypothetical protein
MNYEKIYNQLILRSQSENRKKGCSVYFEKHHIFPKCLGGSNDKSNLISVSHLKIKRNLLAVKNTLKTFQKHYYLKIRLNLFN